MKFFRTLAIIFVIGFVALVIIQAIENNKPHTGKWSECVYLADQAGLDPNDDKVEFIKNCVELK